MRLILPNQPEIERLSMPLKQSLAALKAAISAGWNAQHDGDGAHTDVTANSLAVTNVSTLGRVRMGNIVSYQNLGVIPGPRLDNLTTAGLAQASVLKIRTRTALVNVTGIDSTGRQVGDLLLVINDDETTATPVDISFTAFDANSSTTNQFIGSAASSAPWTLNGSQGLWLMYDSYSPTGLNIFTGWRVLDRI